MPKIKIIDIARIAGVSTGTVDRVIHHRTGVSEKTRIHVQGILEKYDYQPDILAGVLASNKSYKFLVCMPDSVNAHEFWKLPLRGVESALEEISLYDVNVDYLLFDQHSQRDFQKKMEDINCSDYDGMLFAPVFNDLSVKFMKKWEHCGIPIVLFNSYIEGSIPNSFVGQDSFQSGYLGGRIMSYGLEQGRDLLIVNLSLRKDNYNHIIKRERGFRSYFEEHGERVRNLVTLDINGGQYKRVAREIESKIEELDVAGIFVTNSRVYLVAQYLAERGLMNVRLLGYDLLSKSIDYLNREYIDFLISQSPEEQAFIGLKTLFNAVVMKQDVLKENLLPIDILTKENIQYYMKQT